MLDSHRGMKPIQNMTHRRVCRAPYSVDEGRIAVAENDDLSTREPTLRLHRTTNDFMPRGGNIPHRSEM